MQLLSSDQLLVLEILAADLENRPPHGVLTNREIEALRIALPRWIAMERTVTEAHVDAARETGDYPDDFPGAEIYLWPSAERSRSRWQRFKAWCRRQADELCDE